METIILWKGRYYQSLETCRILTSDSMREIRSIIIGLYDKQIYHVEYHIRTNLNWETTFVQISVSAGRKTVTRVLENKNKSWHLDGRRKKMFKNATFVDISLTPFTNTLPIRGLQWMQAPQTIDVIYFDVLSGDIRLVQQVYKRVGEMKYRFETSDASFKAMLTVDNDGLVTRYPSLFKMIGKQILFNN